jgi:hypothetical protein
VSLVVGVATAGAGTAVMGASAAAYPATTVALQAGITAMTSQATISLVNNNGDLGKVFDELGSSESIKNIATAMLTAGVVQGISNVLPANLANATNGSALFTDQLQRQLIDGAASAVVRSAINGTSLEDELRSGLTNALVNTVAAQGANWIGQNGPQGNGNLNAFTAEVAHAIAGCAVGAARAGNGDGCAPGALGAVIGHLTAQFINPTGDPSRTSETIAFSQIIGSIAATMAGGDAQAVHIATGAAGNAVENNWLSQKKPSLLGLSEQEKYDAAVAACGRGDSTACNTRDQLAQISAARDASLRDACVNGGGSSGCQTEVQRAQAAGNRVFVDGQGNITVNGIAFATAGPIVSPFTTSTAGQMAQSTADGLILEAGNQVVGVGVGLLVRGGGTVSRATGQAGNGEGLFTNVARTPYTPTNATFGQAFDFSCVAASCRMAANLTDTPEAYVRQAILTDTTGASLSSIPNGLQQLGFTGTARYSTTTTIDSITTATNNGASVIVNVTTEAGGIHAIVVDSVKGGMAYIRDPWPLGIGSSYAVPVNSLGSVLTGRGVAVHPWLLGIAMQKNADLYLCTPVRSERLRFIHIFDNKFFYEEEKSYVGYLSVNIKRVKLISVISDLKAHGIDCFGVPIEYRDLENISMSRAFDLAKHYANEIGASAYEILKVHSNYPPVYWKFGLNKKSETEEKVGGIVMIDRLDGHVWTDAENEEYMYDYNNIFWLLVISSGMRLLSRLRISTRVDKNWECRLILEIFKWQFIPAVR